MANLGILAASNSLSDICEELIQVKPARGYRLHSLSQFSHL